MSVRFTVGSMLVAMWALGGPLMGQTPSNTLIISGDDIFLQDKEGEGGIAQWKGHRGGRRLALMKTWQIADYLNLSDKQVDKLFPMLRANQKELDEQQAKRQALHKGYSEKLDLGQVTKRDMDRFLDDLAKMDKSRVDLRRKHTKHIEGILTQDQMKKFVLFGEWFRQRLHRIVRPSRPPKAPGRRRAPDKGER